MRLRLAWPLLSALAAALAFAPATAANSISFIGGDGNVWLANPDGTGQHQVTTDGSASDPYFSPSQTDDGIVLAARGSGSRARLYRMRQNGEPLNEPVATPVPPFDPKIAPNGSLVAYYTIAAVVYPDCPYCISTYDQALYSYPDRLTRYGEIPGPNCCSDPSWVGNETIMLTNGSATAWYHSQGMPEAQQWFADDPVGEEETGEHLYDGEVSPPGDKLAVIRGADPQVIALYRMNGPIPAEPTIRCNFSGAPARDGNDFSSLTWSPDGSQLAWEQQGGVLVAPVRSLDDCSQNGPAQMILPGATDPDWSAAPINPPPRRQQETTTTTQGGVPAAFEADLAPRQRLRTVLRRGLRVNVTCTVGCAVTARLRAFGRTLARGRGQLPAAGTKTVRLRFTPSARRRLRRARRLRATLIIDAGAAGRGQGRITLRR